MWPICQPVEQLRTFGDCQGKQNNANIQKVAEHGGAQLVWLSRGERHVACIVFIPSTACLAEFNFSTQSVLST
jgi:hypothetical protein